MNWRWPSTKTNYLLPWFSILRRLLLWVPYQVFRLLAAGCIVLGFSLRDASTFMDDTR